MSESTWLRIRKYIDDHRNQIVYASVFLILLFIGGFWWYLLQLGQVPMAYAGVGGSVFIDENRNGVFDGTEFGFPGVLLRLVNAAGDGATAITDSSGIYGFNVPSGSYTLTMVEEAGWKSSTATTVTFTLEENEILFVNFGSYFETDVDGEEYGSIEGLVFRDVNLNATLEVGEPGIGDVQIRLYDSEGVLLDEALTVGGVFSFTVVPGEYTVVETVPDGYFNTTSAQVDVSVEADEVVEVLFGLEDYSWFDIDDTVVYGFVYNDRNNNKVRDIREKGLAGVTIKLFDGEELVAEVETDEAGFYLISPSSSGEYNLMELDLPGWESSTPNEVKVSLSTGERLQVNFGDRKRGDIDWMPDITGHVFDDRDGDGKLDTGEPGIEGVNVELWLGETLELETTTDEDGSYSFINLPLRVYTVVEIQPSGWYSTTPDEVVVDLEDSSSETVNFGETKGAVISGTVFNDVNVNGVNNAEAGISGVTVRLILSMEQVDSQVTDTNGRYSFTVYKAGLYTVSETNPSGYQSSTPNNVNLNIVTLTGQTITVDFGDYIGIIPPPPPQTKGTIHCYVFHDADGDGEWDEEENPIAGVDIDLYSGEVVIDTVTTGEDGLASFGQRNTGAYTVVENDPEGWVSTTSNTVQFTLSSGETEVVEFGDRKGGWITGVVYDDADKDGERGVDEPGIEGVSVDLYLGEVLVDETVTSEDGSYMFSILEPGNYWVVETDLKGWRSSTPNEVEVPVVDVEEQTYNADFGDYEYPYGDILGIVFDDQDGDGVLDDEEPGIEEVVVSLYDEGGLLAATTTDEDGLYSFMELSPGLYEVRADPKDNYFRTTPGTVMLEVEVGDEKEVNFGYVYVENPFGVVYGTVYNDKDGDKDRSFGELGLSGVTVSLKLGDDLVTTETTNEYGQYTFRIDEAATYVLVEEDPEGWHSTTLNEITIEAYTYDDNGSPWDFGDTLGATVSGIVWDDEDKDGEKGVEETGISGVLVELYLDQGFIEGTLTLEDGSYSFLVLASGDYTVEETDPAGYDSSTPNQVPVSVGDLTGQMYTVDFGDYLIPVGSVEGIVFNDLNGNGEKDEGEGGLAGATVSVYDSDEELVAWVETGEDGGFMFEELPIGLYRVVEENPEGFISTTPDSLVVEVELGEVEVVNFGDVRESELIPIYGVVFNDVNLNGVQDYELGIPGVTVELYEGETKIDETVTGVYGSYALTATLAGSYVVRETDLEGYMSTTPNEVTLTVGAGNSYQVDFGDALIEASITVDKKVKRGDDWYDGPIDLLTGDTVEFQYTVTNNGNVPLSNVQVEDDVEGQVTLGTTTLAPGEFTTGTLSSTVESDINSNTATATGHYESPTPPYTAYDPEDEDTASYFGGAPGVTMNKQIMNIDSDWVEYAILPVDGTAYYRFIVTNNGDVELTNIFVYDPDLTVTLDSTELPPGETTYGYADTTVQPGLNPNDAHVEGSWSGYDVWYDDSAAYDGVAAYLQLTKLIKGEDGTWYTDPETAYVEAGEEVEFKFYITNMCELPFKEVTVYDNVLGWITLPSTDIPGDGYIEAYATATALQGYHENEATAYGECGNYVFPGFTSYGSYYGVDASVQVDKQIKNPDGDWVDETYLKAGGDVWYRFVVTNTGDETLDDFTLSDDALGPIIFPATSLAPGQSFTTDPVKDTAEVGQHINTVMVTARIADYYMYGFEQVSDTDTAWYIGGELGMTLTKEVSTDNTNWYTHVDLPKDGTVYFRFTVENTGDEILSDVQGYDPDLGQAIEFAETTLDPDETTVNKYTISVSALSGLHENTAEAYAEWNGVPEKAYGSASYFGVEIDTVFQKQVRRAGGAWHDSIAYVKTGDEVEYRFIIENNGNVDLTSLVIDDPDVATINVGTVADGDTYTSDTQTVTSVAGAYTNTATLNGETMLGPFAELSDSAEYEAAMPSITLTKEVSLDESTWLSYVEVPVGGTVYFRFTVKNTGDVELTDVSLSDTSFGLIASGLTLSVDEEQEYFRDTTDPGPGVHENTATVEGYWHDLKVKDTDDASYLGDADAAPEITVTKMVSLDGSTGWTEHVDVLAGTTVWFRIRVENTGNVQLSGVEVQDSVMATPYVVGDMLPGEDDEYTYSWTAVPGDFENTATATGTYYGDDYSDEYSATVFGGVVDMKLTKYVMDLDGLWQDDSAPAVEGTTVEYKYVLENTGNVPITVTLFRDVTLDTDFTTGALGVGETWTEYASTTAELGVHENQAVAEGQWMDNWVEVEDWAEYEAVEAEPAITVTKEVSKDNADWFDHVEVPVGNTVYFRFTLENTGNVELSAVELSDTTFGVIVDGLTLGPGETATYYRDLTAKLCTHTNTATVTGGWKDATVESTDDASYEGYNPLIAVLKVPSMGAPKTSPVLRSDRDYVIVAEGTFWVNYPTVIADAQYWSTSHNKWQWTSYNPASDGHSFLQMNGADVNWGPFSNGDTGHRYQIEPQGNDASVVFRIVDWYDGDYSNNCSSSYLTVYVYEYR